MTYHCLNHSNCFIADVDFVTPLCTQVTYEGLLDDTFGISSGKFSTFQLLYHCLHPHFTSDTPFSSTNETAAFYEGFIEFGPEVTGTDKSMKMLLTAQDMVNCYFLFLINFFGSDFAIIHRLFEHKCNFSLTQVYEEIRDRHFSNVFGFLSAKAKELQAGYDVSITDFAVCFEI